MVLDDAQDQRVADLEDPDLDQQALAEVPRRDARRVELLDLRQGATDQLLFEPGLAGHVLDRGLQVPVVVEVAEDPAARAHLGLVERRDADLPLQVLGQRVPTREGLVDGGPVVVARDPGVEPGLRVALQVVLPLDVRDLLGVGGARVTTLLRGDVTGGGRLVDGGHLVDLGLCDRLGGAFGGRLGTLPFRGRSVAGPVLRRLGRLGARRLVALGLLEDRVLLQLLLDQRGELLPVQLQQLDRLLQLRRHDELLGESQLLSELDGHLAGCLPRPCRFGQ